MIRSGPQRARARVAYDFTRLDVGSGGTPNHTDLPRMRAGGMGAQFWSVYVPCRLTGDDAVSATLRGFVAPAVQRSSGTSE